MADWGFSVLPSWNDRLDAIASQSVPEAISVISAIGDQALATPDFGQQYANAFDIAVMAGRQVDGDRPSEEVCSEVDFGGSATARDANRLILRLFFGAPAAERWALT